MAGTGSARSAAVRRWHDRLAARPGLGRGEIAVRQSALEMFCARHRVDPDQLLTTWERYSELTVRRRPGAAEAPNLAVESFLIHNGINVFGEIVCVAGQREDLAEQGPQFVPDRPA